MARISHTLSLVLMYSFIVSVVVPSNSRSVLASRRVGLESARTNDQGPIPSPNSVPSSNPTPTPSPLPDPEPSSTPDPTPTPYAGPSPIPGVPGMNLPNLDSLPNVQPVEPEIPEAIPSTQCSPAQPDCHPTPGSQISYSHAVRSRRLTPSDRRSSSAFHQFLALGSRHSSSTVNDASLPLLEPLPVTGSYDDFVMARLDPDNRVGTGGDDVLSRNFNWSLPLVGMTGRSGLNLGLSLSYNSLVWTRSGSDITYDADNGYPTPGFRLGFPVVYGQHVNSRTGTYGYLMLMPSGSRVELRKIGSTNVFEAADSSYLQLTDNGDGTLLMRSTDGMQLSYASTNNGFRCTQVKDRNGNYLSIINSSEGRLLTITDTLGRDFNFNYDENDNLTSISQTRGSSQYTWVTFGYSDMSLEVNFTGLTIIGTQNHANIPILSQVGLPDGSYYKFAYNTWGQVYKITNYAADSNPETDSHPLNYVSYNLPMTSGTAQTDCPRFTQRKDWAENWNNSAEAVTNFSVPSATGPFTMVDGTVVNWLSQKQTPDGVYYNVYTRSSGWDEGMPVLVNTYDAQVALQRQELTTRTQDNTSVSYMLNPRVTESNIYDPSGNHKRTSISYSTSFGLPTEVKEYAADATTVLRTSQTDYNLDSNYANRRIIGLASQKRVYDNANGNALISKVNFVYDEIGDFLVQQGTPIRHDTTNYGSSFTWRGNLTKVKRWDVINTSAFVESKTGYNTTGSPIFTRDPLDHQVSISYADTFVDLGNMNTYAYPTTTTDADGNQSSSQYHYNVGVMTKQQGPPTNTASPAAATGAYITYSYDSVGRLIQVWNSYNSATTTNYYPTSSNVVQTYTTIQNGLPSTVSAKLLDGAGRVRATAAEHPGSTGGYVGQLIVYDVMGRGIATSNPTEIYGSWSPAGDDAVGWVYSYLTYDWKGRPRVTTNQDGSTKEATYGGCGCAGGEVVTLRDEVNRYSKSYHDVLGRVTKTEELNPDQTVFRTTTNIYNGRHQVTSASVQQGTSGSAQISTMTYDGYGRLSTSHTPIQADNTVTSYTYNADDSILTTMDARGVVATFAYNNRHQTTGVSYPNTAPSGIPETTAASFTYDAAGNRSSMTDGLGSLSYQYDPLSRLTSEARVFTNLSTTPYTLNYGYNLAGQLTSITEPGDVQVGYVRDLTGRLTGVTGTGYASDADYVSEIKYRASGTLKNLTYQNGVQASLNYTNRMQPSNYKLTSPNTQNLTPMDVDYVYAADGLLRNSTDKRDATLDRAYKYDQVGRLSEAFTGSEARSWVQTGSIGTTVDGPYRQTYTLDTWNNMTTKWGRSFLGTTQQTQTVNYTYSATTGRNNAWSYDANGNATSADGTATSYDEAGRPYQVVGSGGIMSEFKYDGDGRKAKRTSDFDLSVPTQTYYLFSSVLGQTLKEIGGVSGDTGFVYADGELVATRNAGIIYWQHKDPSLRSMRTTVANGSVLGREELDPNDVTVFNPFEPPQPHGPGSGGGPHGPGGVEAQVASLMNIATCSFATMAVPCAMVGSLQKHLGGIGGRMLDHWNGITTWNITVTAKFKDGTIIRRFNPIKAGLFAFRSSSFYDSKVRPAGFTWNYAIAAAKGMISGDDEGMARQGQGGKKDNKKYKRELTDKEWSELESTFELARQAVENPECGAWLTSDIYWESKPNPLGELNNLISIKHFFYGGKPGSIATTYSNGGGAVAFAWIGLRRLFFDERNKWERVNTILHELRHAMHLGRLAHPDSFESDAEKVTWLESGFSIESQGAFNRGVEKHCLSALKKSSR